MFKRVADELSESGRGWAEVEESVGSLRDVSSTACSTPRRAGTESVFNFATAMTWPTPG
jgi:hypothetical protein